MPRIQNCSENGRTSSGKPAGRGADSRPKVVECEMEDFSLFLLLFLATTCRNLHWCSTAWPTRAPTDHVQLLRDGDAAMPFSCKYSSNPFSCFFLEKGKWTWCFAMDLHQRLTLRAGVPPQHREGRGYVHHQQDQCKE